MFFCPCGSKAVSGPFLGLKLVVRNGTYVDDVDNSLRLFGLTAAVSSDVYITLGN